MAFRARLDVVLGLGAHLEFGDARLAFWLIVYAHRSGRVLFVPNAFRAFTNDIDLSLACPVDVLRASVRQRQSVSLFGSTRPPTYIGKRNQPP